MRRRAVLLYATCCAIWGSTWLVIKIGLADLPPLRFAAWRMGIACLLLTAWAFRGWRRPTRAELGSVALAGFLQIGVSYALIFAAERTIASGLTAVLFSSFPIWVALFAHLYLPNEPLRAVAVVAGLLGFAGVGILELPAIEAVLEGGRFPIAAVLPLGAAIASAFANVWMKSRLSRVSSALNLWGQTLVGTLFLVGISIVFESGSPAHWTVRSVGALVYLAIPGTVVAFLSLFWLIPRVPMASIGAIPLIDTLVAVTLGSIVLGESVGWRLWLGGAMILTGAALATRGVPGSAVRRERAAARERRGHGNGTVPGGAP